MYVEGPVDAVEGAVVGLVGGSSPSTERSSSSCFIISRTRSGSALRNRFRSPAFLGSILRQKPTMVSSIDKFIFVFL